MHNLTVGLLQGSPSWDKLVRRSCPYNQNRNEEEKSFHDWIEDQADSHGFPIKCLAKILVEMKNPEDSMLELLHVICQRFPPIAYMGDEVHQPMLFQLSCPCKRSHSVSHLGFLLLEVAEVVTGSAAQQVEKVKIGRMEGPWLTGLGNRVTRQQRAVKEVFLPIVTLFTLSFVCKRWSLIDSSAEGSVMWSPFFLSLKTARG